MMGIKGKKAQGGAGMTLAVASVVIVFILLIYMIFSSVITAGISLKVKTSSLDISEKNQAKTSLEAYLNTPVSITINNESKEILMSDLIRLAYSDRAYQKELQEKTHQILDPVYKEYILHAGIMEIVSGVGRPQLIELYLPSEEPIKVIFGIVGEK